MCYSCPVNIEEHERVLRVWHGEEVRTAGREKQLGIVSEMVYHDGKNCLFDIALNAGEHLITVVQSALSAEDICQHAGNANALQSSAGELIPVCDLPLLKDDPAVRIRNQVRIPDLREACHADNGRIQYLQNALQDVQPLVRIKTHRDITGTNKRMAKS